MQSSINNRWNFLSLVHYSCQRGGEAALKKSHPRVFRSLRFFFASSEALGSGTVVVGVVVSSSGLNLMKYTSVSATLSIAVVLSIFSRGKGNEVCKNGIVGSAYDVEICCAASCGKCGAEVLDCGHKVGGPLKCCSRDIYLSKRECVGDSDVGCILSVADKEARLKRAAMRGTGIKVVEDECSVVINNSERAPMLRVALVLSGLMRSKCPTINFQDVFFKPLRQDKEANYVVDVIVSVNLVKFEKAFQQNTFAAVVDPLNFLQFKPCAYTAQDQGSLDMKLYPILNATCGRYGDAWKDPTCMTTMNFLRAMGAQQEAARIIVGREKTKRILYDVVVNARIDVLFTWPLPFSLYRYPSIVVVLPHWGRYRGGYNDRFSMGGRDHMVRALNMLDYALEFCENAMSPEGPRILHSESFTRWLLEDKIGATVIFSDAIKMRRVRGGEELIYEHYTCDPTCPLDVMETCDATVVKRTGVCTGSSNAKAQSDCRPDSVIASIAAKKGGIAPAALDDPRGRAKFTTNRRGPRSAFIY